MEAHLDFSILVARKGHLDRDHILRACRQLPHVGDDPEGGLRYENPDTGVRFRTVLAESGNEPVPESFRDTGLRVQVPLLRPRFFAEETFEALRTLQGADSMWGVPSSEDEVRVPRSLGSAWPELVAAWERSSLRVARGGDDAADAPWYWPRARAEEWWRYMRQKQDLQERLMDSGVFVPRVFLFVDPQREAVVRTAFAWDDCSATLFPPCDWVLVLDRSAEATASGQDTRLRGIAERDAALAALGELAQPVADQGCAWPMLPAHQLARARPIFKSLTITPAGPLRGITPASVVDVR